MNENLIFKMAAVHVEGQHRQNPKLEIMRVTFQLWASPEADLELIERVIVQKGDLNEAAVLGKRQLAKRLCDLADSIGSTTA